VIDTRITKREKGTCSVDCGQYFGVSAFSGWNTHLYLHYAEKWSNFCSKYFSNQK